MIKKRVLFFLHHYNDIDHMTPVIWKWAVTTSVPSIVVISNTADILDDYRIRFLRGLNNIEVHLIDEFIPPDLLQQRTLMKEIRAYNWRISQLPRIHPLRLKRKALSVLGSPPAEPNHISDENRLIAEHLMERTMSNVDHGLIVFDWISDNMGEYLKFANLITDMARERGFGRASLPHGDEPHYCKMIRRDELNYNSADIYTKAKDLFDYLAVPNKLCAIRYRRHMSNDCIKVLGSPRYNDEWLSKIHQLIPPYQFADTENKLKIVFFLRHFLYPLFWDEIVRTIQLITQFPEVHLIVVHHTRDVHFNKLINAYPELAPRRSENLEIIAEGSHSSALIRWADIILDVGTSAVFEAIKLDKPVLEMEYLHATHTVISHYIDESVMWCRDHLYDTLQAFESNRNYRVYDENQRRIFVETMIDVPDPNVLPRYVDFLNESFQDR